MRFLLLFLALNTASVYLASQLLSGFQVTGGALGFVVVGLIIGILNAIVKPVLQILSLPFLFLTIGLFVLVINAFILFLAQKILLFFAIPGVSLTIVGTGNYVMSVLFLGIFNYIFHKLLR